MHSIMPATRSPDADALRCICFNLRKATRAITHLYDASLRPSGLRATQFTVLNVIRRLAPATMTRIADVSVIDRTTLTRSLALLERDGLVELAPSADGRERCYAVTARGVRVLEQAARRWDEAQAQVVSRLGPERVRRLLADLDAVVLTGREHKRARVARQERRR